MQANGIAIFGTGAFGEQVYRQCRFRYEVRCFLDNFPKAKEKHERPVMRPMELLEKFKEGARPLIVVATRDYCADVSAQLRAAGLVFGEDFITYRELPGETLDYFSLRENFTEEEATRLMARLRQGKKLAILFGNCQLESVQRMLLRCPLFTERYVIMQLPPVYSYTPMKLRRLYETKFWQLCNLFISQHVAPRNRFAPELATDRLVKLLPPKAKTLWIPTVMFRGYFPQVTRNKRNVDTDLHQSGRFPFADRYVDQLVQSGGAVDDIVRTIAAEDYLKPAFVQDFMETSLREMEYCDFGCDVKIHDYVEAHGRTRQLFYSEGHPTLDLLKEMARRLMTALGLAPHLADCSDLELGPFSLKGQDVPVYPSVIRALGLKEYDTVYYPNRYLWPFKGNLVEYTEEYLRRCWGMVV